GVDGKTATAVFRVNAAETIAARNRLAGRLIFMAPFCPSQPLANIKTAEKNRVGKSGLNFRHKLQKQWRRPQLRRTLRHLSNHKN
ncbi:MAG TPA: hypothetical protein VHC44_06695, partial [Verrucomicrobiae bacterium]|nr:hypothetical protein [Verrucomicrobiae bacterium]